MDNTRTAASSDRNLAHRNDLKKGGAAQRPSSSYQNLPALSTLNDLLSKQQKANQQRKRQQDLRKNQVRSIEARQQKKSKHFNQFQRVKEYENKAMMKKHAEKQQ